MNKSTIAIAAVLLLSLIALEPVLGSGSMRCGTHIISAGGRSAASMYEVLKKCGEPQERFGNTWVYEDGSSKRKVHFDPGTGTVQRIE